MNADGLPLFLQVTAALGMLLAAAGSFISVAVSLRNGRTGRGIATETKGAAGLLQEIKLTINGRLDELLATTRALAHVEGAAAARAIDKIDPVVTATAAAAVLSVAKDLAGQSSPTKEPT